VPGNAELYVDVRFSEIEYGNDVDNQIRKKAKNPFNKDIKVEIDGGIMRPPTILTEKTDKLCRIIEEIGKKHGIDVNWETSGGGSDASFAAAMGIPALCGLTAVGGRLHSDLGFLEISDIEARFEVYKELIYKFSNLQSE
jgi:glutamate carboxypeptidase